MKLVKKMEFLSAIVILLFVLWGLSATNICRKAAAGTSLYDNCNKIKSKNSLTITPTPTSWKTYTDNVHGFSFQYPDSWNNKDLSKLDDYASNGEPAGVAILTSNIEKCESSDKYVKEILIPKYGNIQPLPILNQNIDGFVVDGYHLDDLTSGPEAYVVNCPYLIRIGFVPANEACDESLFDQVISTMKTWKPTE